MKTIRIVSTKSNLEIEGHMMRFVKWVLLLLLLTLAMISLAQSDRLETEQGLKEAIASFDADIRANLLVASEYPGILTQLRNSQTQTSESFQTMIGHFRKKKQEWFYTITRYPELLHNLATLPARQTQDQINKLLPHQDPDLKEASWRLYRSEQRNLIKLDNIQQKANREFEKSISYLSPRAREAFKALQSKPDVLNLLTNNIDLTAKLGEHYRNNPSEVSSQLASLHDRLEIQNQRDATAFKKQMEDDPKAAQELRQASSAYAANSYYNNPYWYPYSYWFGYPYWYSYPMWYPGLFWYTPGFYFGVNGLYGMPSFGFTYWFYYGGYYARYPHLYRQFGTYYQNSLARTRSSMSIADRGFMNAASSYYRPGSRTSRSPFSYRPSSTTLMNRGFNTNRSLNSMSRPAVNNYHMQSWNRGGSIGGGFHGGGVHVGRH